MTALDPHAFLNSFVNFESRLHHLLPEDFDIERIRKFLTLAGDPAKKLKIVHVAGTKGKGSTCAFLANALQEAGYKVGLYTSPHLHKINERIRILGPDTVRAEDDFCGAIPDEELASVLNFLRPWAIAIQNEGKALTYFEVLTVAALVYFANNNTDIVILETGLGGRLDATNAADSLIAVITPVSLDHTRILGSTLGQIAFEKSGIIKNSSQKVVIAVQEKEAMDVILKRCGEFGIKPVLVDPDQYQNLKIGLKGGHQRINAVTALEVLKLLKTMGFEIKDKAMNWGLSQVRWPGRFELLRKAPDVIVDCAHNGASAQALVQTLKDVYPGRQIVLVLGISEDKDASAICGCFNENVKHALLTKANHPRAHVFTETEARQYFGGKHFEIINGLPQAIDKALQLADLRDIIVVTGSIFGVAEARDYLAH